MKSKQPHPESDISRKALLSILEDEKHARQELQISEERFRRLAENAPDMIYRMSLPDGKYEYVSPAAQTIFGYSPEEFYCTPVFIQQTIHPDWQKYFKEQWTNLLQGEMPPTYEYQIIHKSGKVCWLNQRNILVYNKVGDTIAIEGIVTDITERKQYESDLQARLLELETIHHTSQRLQSLLPADRLSQEIITILEKYLKYGYAAVLLIEKPSGRLIPFAISDQGKGEGFVEQDKKDILSSNVRIGEGITGKVAKTGKSFFSGEVSQEPEYKVLRQGIRSELCVPLWLKNEVIGVINIETDAADAYNQSDQRVLETIAAQISVAIQNSKLLKKVQEQIMELEEEIQKRELTEKTLQKSELLLSETGRIAKIGGWEFNVETGEGTWTDEVARIHEVDPDKKPSMELGLSFYHDTSRSKIEAAIREAIELGASYDLELELTTAKGNHKWVRTIGQPVTEQGKTVKIRGSFQDITSFKIAEKEVKDTETRYRTLFNNSMDAILLTAPAGAILDVNDATCRMFGKTAEKIIKAGRNGLVDTGDPRLKKALAEREQTGQVQAEITMVRADGTKFPAEISSTVFTDSQGQKRTSMIIRDISERKQAEEALRDSEELFSKIFSASPIALSIATVSDGKLVKVNDAWQELMGYSREEAIGNNVEELKITDRKLRSKLREEFLRKGNLRLVENEITTKSGEKKRILTSAEIISIKGQQFSINLVVDITERKLAEEELQKLKIFFEQLFIQSATSTQILDKDGWCLRINPKLSELFGVNPENIEGKQYNIFNDQEIKRNGIDAILKKVFQQQTTEEWEVFFDVGEAAKSQQIAIKENKKVWYYNKAFPILDSKGDLVNVIVQHENITDRKEAEDLVYSTMNRLVEAEEALKREAAQQLHDQVGQNLTALSLNLSFVQSQVRQWKSEKLDARLGDSISLIEDTMERIRNIMTELRPSLLDDYGLHAALQWSLTVFTERTGLPVDYIGQDLSRRLSLNIEFALYRMIQELLHNVIRHARARKVWVNLDEQQDQVRISIKDNGIGFDLKELARRKEEGGFGLVGIKERMKALGGKVEINSSKGKGTAILLEFKHEPI